jgi:TetR/AcrR family transcriptional regulator, transcriptional repressor for nem operon
MARPREFDEARALESAMNAFWERGYNGTSVSDLITATGLNKGSLYGAFGDKRRLFLRAVDYYQQAGLQTMRQALEQPGSAREAIARWMSLVVQGCCAADGWRGCFVFNTAVEMAPHDEEIAQWVRQVMRRSQQMFRAALERGQAQGEFSRGLNCEAAACFLVVSVAGMRVICKTSPTPRELRGVVDLILSVLD